MRQLKFPILISDPTFLILLSKVISLSNVKATSGQKTRENLKQLKRQTRNWTSGFYSMLTTRRT